MGKKYHQHAIISTQLPAIYFFNILNKPASAISFLLAVDVFNENGLQVSFGEFTYNNVIVTIAYASSR